MIYRGQKEAPTKNTLPDYDPAVSPMEIDLLLFPFSLSRH